MLHSGALQGLTEPHSRSRCLTIRAGPWCVYRRCCSSRVVQLKLIRLRRLRSKRTIVGTLRGIFLFLCVSVLFGNLFLLFNNYYLRLDALIMSLTRNTSWSDPRSFITLSNTPPFH